MKRWRGADGQASAEYVALVALVAVALALAAGLSSGGVGGQVLAGLQRGLCVVARTGCPHREPPRADLDPCPVERRTRVEQLGTTIAVLRLGSGGTLSAVRASDGRVTVTLAHGNDVGVEVGVGARLPVGGRTLGGSVRAAAGIGWIRALLDLPDAREARRFVVAYGARRRSAGSCSTRRAAVARCCATRSAGARTRSCPSPTRSTRRPVPRQR